MADNKVIEVLDKNELIEIVETIIIDHEYALKKTKVPSKKRTEEKTIKFWHSIKFHLIK